MRLKIKESGRDKQLATGSPQKMLFVANLDLESWLNYRKFQLGYPYLGLVALATEAKPVLGGGDGAALEVAYKRRLAGVTWKMG
jgi:hypothetical protein